MALQTKKVAGFAMSGITVVSVSCYRFATKHPFISSLLCSLGVLYICYPKVFFFLVSSSPVLVSTALLLGTLLSLGQPHIPQIDDLYEEEEDNLEASSKALEDDDDEKKRGINLVDETSGDDDPLLQKEDDHGDASSVVTDVPVTKVMKRRFEEGIDDFSAKRYVDSETLLGRRTEIVETIEEEEEQCNVEDLDDSDDRVRNDKIPENVDFTPSHKREVEEVAATENKGAGNVVDEFNHIDETSLEKEPENMAHKEEISEKTGEEATLEGEEGHAIEGNKKEACEREDPARSINLSDTETMIERSLDKPMKEIEEEIPLLGHPSSSTPEIIEEALHPRMVDMDSSEGTSESQGIDGKVEATVGDEPRKVSDDVEVSGQKPSLENFFSLELRSSWKRFTHRHSPSDSGSDAAESISSDASLGQLDPMFDEHHPLLEYEGSKASSVSNSSVEEGFHVEDFSPRQTVSESFVALPHEPQVPSDAHEDEEEEEEEEEEEAPNDFGFTWTEDDEKNLRDLGLSERERVQQLERFTVDLHAQHPQGAQEENLIDFYSEERVSHIEEENLVEIGIAGETTAKEAVAIDSESVDHQAEGNVGSASKEIELEMCIDSSNRDIPSDVHFDSGREEKTTELQCDQVDKKNSNALPQDNSSLDHLEKYMPNDLESPEDVSQPSGDAFLAEANQEMPHVEASSIEEIELAPRGVIVEDADNIQIQDNLPKDSLQSTETIQVAQLGSPMKVQMSEESILSDISSIQEQSKAYKNTTLDDHLSSSSSSADETEIESVTVQEECGVVSPEKFGRHSQDVEANIVSPAPVHEAQWESIDNVEEVPSKEEHESRWEENKESSDNLKNSGHHSQDIEMKDVLSVPVVEIPRGTIDTVAEVHSTEEYDGQKEGKEASDDSSSSASEKFEMTAMEMMVDKSVVLDEDIEVLSPSESKEMIEPLCQDASLATAFVRDDSTTLVEEAFSENQHEKMEATHFDSSPSASGEFDLATGEVTAEASTYKNDVVQVESLEVEEKPNEKGQATEEDSSLETETQGDMVSKEEQAPKEEKSDEHLNDTSYLAAAETESTSGEFVEGDLVGKLKEINEAPLQISQGSSKTTEAIETNAPLVVEMLGGDLPTARERDVSEAQEVNLEEHKELSDDLSFSATNMATSGEQGLIMLDVKSKEELESVLEHVVLHELDNKYEESHFRSSESDQECTQTIEQAEQDSTLQTHVPRDSFSEDAAPEERQPVPEETENTSDESSSSASDISSFERIEELTSLEISSKEQIEDALKEAIAEELSHKNKEVQFSPVLDSEKPTETVEPTIIESPPGIDMQRDVSPSAIPSTYLTEEHHSEPEKTIEACNDLNSAAMEVRKIPSSDGGEIQ